MEFPQNFQSGRETNREPLWIDHMDRIEFDLKKTKQEVEQKFIKINDTHWWGAEVLNSGPKCGCSHSGCAHA